MNKIAIVIYEDESGQRENLIQLFSGSDDIELKGAFNDCQHVKKQMEEFRPDVVLMDIEMDGINGLDAMINIKSAFPETDVIMLTGVTDDNMIFKCLKAGASGYIDKGISPSELKRFIHVVFEGGTSFTPSIAEKIRDFFIKGLPNDSTTIQLTDREKETLTYLCDGLSNKLIADRMSIGINGVAAHLKKIFLKLQVNSAPEAVATALRMRLLDPEKLKFQ